MDASDSDKKIFSEIRGAFLFAVSLSERPRAGSVAVSKSGLAGIPRHIGVTR
jgi:hypothetical protein